MFNICLVVILLLSLFHYGCYPQKQKKAADRIIQGVAIEDDKNFKDLGQVREGELIKHSFVILNEWDRPLSIKEVSTSCGCAVAKIGSKVLGPWESANLDIVFNTEGYSGEVKQFIYVSTDNLDMPTIRFIIKADIKK
ncbi:MAG: DUF1573 domain-containing protein [Candidatus Omnitrophica bacterium]|nr:DUF1573 domain-containing protein [Candidatus Omnitrophota bacterium]